MKITIPSTNIQIQLPPTSVEKAVYARIDFPLPKSTWEAIEDAFTDCWDNVIGIGGDVYFNEIFDFVNGHLKKRHILLSPDNLAHILKIMFDHLEMNGCFVDDSRCPNDPDPPTSVEKAVYARIDFPLPKSTWKAVEDAFADCWDNVIGDDVYFNEIFDFVNDHLKKRHILLPPDNLAHILKIMFDHLEMIGWLVDDSRCPNNPDNLTQKQKETKEIDIRIREASEAGKREVEEMLKHPLSEEEVQHAIETAQETLRLSRELTLLTDRDTDTVYLSAWLARDYPAEYAAITAALDRHGVPHHLLPHTADYWCRDYMPIQVSPTRFIGYTYRPDYLRDTPRYITDPAPVCRTLGITPDPVPLVLDGGNIVKCPTTVILTEKVFHENPDRTPAQITSILEQAFQADILYLPWDRAEPYGHADGIVRPIDAHRVLFTNYRDFDPAIADEMLRRLRRHFKVFELHYDVPEPHPNSWAYINYLQTSRVILLPSLRIPEDAQALRQIRHLFPDYADRIEPIPIAPLVRQGGALNCLTWNTRALPH